MSGEEVPMSLKLISMKSAPTSTDALTKPRHSGRGIRFLFY